MVRPALPPQRRSAARPLSAGRIHLAGNFRVLQKPNWQDFASGILDGFRVRARGPPSVSFERRAHSHTPADALPPSQLKPYVAYGAGIPGSRGKAMQGKLRYKEAALESGESASASGA